MRIALYLLLAIFIISCGSSFEQKEHLVDQVEDKKFDEFKKEFIDTLCHFDPLWANKAGLYHCDSLLIIPNSEYREKKIVFAQDILDSLSKFQFEVLSRKNQNLFYRIENFAKSTIFNLTVLKEWEWNPAFYTLYDDFFHVLNAPDISLNKRLRAIDKKLEKVPEYYIQAKMNIYHPTIVHTQYAIDTMKVSLLLFETAIPDFLQKAGKIEFSKDSFNLKLQTATTAIKDYVGWLENDLLPNMDSNNTRDFRLGKEKYSQKFDLECKSIYKANEIYSKAMEEKARVTEEMFQLADSLWPKYFGILKKPENKKLEMIQMIIDTVSVVYDTLGASKGNGFNSISAFVEFAEDNDLFPDNFFVEGSLGKYKQDTTHSISEIKSFLAKQTYLFYDRTLTDNLMMFSGKSSTLDAWSLYSLNTMLDEGFGDNNPELWLMSYGEYLKNISSAILGYNVHVYGLNKVEAMEMLMHEIFLTKQQAEKNWKEISIHPLQNCNRFVGYYEIIRLRDELKSRLGDDFELEDFHEYFLSFGDLPVKNIRLQMME